MPTWVDPDTAGFRGRRWRLGKDAPSQRTPGRDRIPWPCSECGELLWALTRLFDRPGFADSVLCDDYYFDQFGDMLTPAEPRNSELRNPEHRDLRDQWLAEYERAGIADDQDPSLIVLDVSVPDEPDDDFLERLVPVIEDAFRLPRAGPGDFAGAAS